MDEFTVEYFVDAIEDYRKANEARDNDPVEYVVIEDSPTWVALDKARIYMHKMFEDAVEATILRLQEPDRG